MIPVAANDVAFSVHAVALTAFTLFQVLIYEVSNPFLYEIIFLLYVILSLTFFPLLTLFLPPFYS